MIFTVCIVYKLKIFLHIVKSPSLSAEQYPCLDDEERTQLVAEIITEYNAGVIGLPGAVEENPWEISRSFFFVSTVITTIGKY